MTDPDQTPVENVMEAMTRQIMSGMQNVMQVTADKLAFEGREYPIVQQKVAFNISGTVSLNNQPVELKQAYAVVLAANTAYLRALAEARATVHLQQTKIADLQAELQHLRPEELDEYPENPDAG